MILADALGFNPMKTARSLALRRLAPPPPPPPPPRRMGFIRLRPALAPPPPPPPPQSWQQKWLAHRARIAEMQANRGAGHFNGFGRPVRRMMARPRPMRVRQAPRFFPRYLQPTVLPVETIYLQPLPGCTVRPNPIPPCSGTLTWVDDRTVCCR